MNISQCVILAAGEGARMRPLTYTRSKVMLPVVNKPILEHLLLAIKQAGIKEFIFIVGYKEQQIRNHFGNGEKWGVKVEYRRQNTQLGTANALRLVRGLIDTNFLLANGDSIFEYHDIINLLDRNNSSLGVMELDDVTGFGVIETKGDRIIRICEKMEVPISHLVNAGLYLFTPEIFEAVEKTPRSHRGEYELPDAIQLLIDDGRKIEFSVLNHWLDLTYPWDMLTVNEKMIGKADFNIAGEVENNVVIKAPVSIGQGTIVRSGSYIVGPVAIGNDCEIGPNCYLRPSTTVGDKCHIGAGVEVKNSIIMSGSKVPHLSYVGDSVIGVNCNFGAGTKIANLRLDKTEVHVGGIKTKRRKLGAIIGDNVETGINASINVGALIGNDSFVGPGALASGVVLPRSRIS